MHCISQIVLLDTRSVYVCSKGIFMYNRMTYPNLVISSCQIQFGEVSGPMKLIQHVIDCRDEEAIFDGDGVEGPIVDAKLPMYHYSF